MKKCKIMFIIVELGMVMLIINAIKDNYSKVSFLENSNMKILVYILIITSAHIFMIIVLRLIFSKITLEKDKAYEKIEKYAQIFLNAKWGLALITSDDSSVEKANQGLEKMIGLTTKELKDIRFIDLFAEEDKKSFLNQFKLAETDEASSFEARMIHKNGDLINVLIDIVIIKSKDDSVSYKAINIQDITQRKKSEEKLKKTKAALSEVERIANIGSWKRDFKTEKFFLSKQAYRIHGIQPTDFDGKSDTILKYIYPEDRKKVNKAIMKGFQTKKLPEIEHRIIRPTGEIRTVTQKAELYFDSKGEPNGIQGIIYDITESKKSREALIKSQEMLEESQRIAKLGSWEWNGKSDEVSLTDETYRILELDKNNYDGKYEILLNLIHEDDIDRFLSVVSDSIINRNFIEIEHRIVLPNKDEKSIFTQAKVYYNELGKPIKISGTVLDITRLKVMQKEKEDLEKQLFQSKKLETIGTLAGGIAHDLNNILTPVIGYIDIALLDMDNTDSSYFLIEKALESALQAKELIKQILTFSRQSELDKESLCIKDVVKKAVKLVKSVISSSINISEYYEDQCGEIFANEAQIYQIIMNLCVNAYQAMNDDSGEIEIKLRKVLIDNKNYIELTVTDTGSGMDPETLEKIFDPFYTTKTNGRGIGLGLSVVHGIVKSYKGNFEVESELGKGSKFKIFLPSYEDSKDIQKKEEENLGRSKANILIVDDKHEIIYMMKRMLERFGYEITITCDSMEALSIFESNSNVFDIVITDYDMPKLNGLKLAAKLREIRQDIPIILMSGFFKDNIGEKSREIGIDGYIYKPVNSREIQKIISDVLNKMK